MADKRISQLVDRGTVANNDVVPIVVSGATTTNKATISSIQTFMQGNLDLGVTSVGITLGSSGTDVNVTGSPITSSGNITINFPTASATNRGLLSSADWTTFNNKVSSVGLSMPSAFAVANSPITGSGTIAVTGAGTVSQYIRGDGSLADFPSGGGGGGSSVNYYLNGSVSQGTIGGIAYLEMNKVPVLGAGTDFTIAADGYIASFITDAGDPALLEIPAGNWNFETYLQASSGGGTPTFYIELYKVNSGGTATLIASNSATPELIAFGTTTTPYFSALAVPTTSLTLTDRLALRYYVTHSGRTITLHTENATLCQIITTFTTGLTALNGLTAQVQNFATGTSGTDFGISSSVSTHTFNLPDASTSARGVVTTGAQNFAGNKSFQNTIFANAGVRLDQNGTALPTFVQNISGTGLSTTGANGVGFNNTNNFFFAGSDKGCAVFEVNNTGTRNYTLQNASGTLAFTSDLTGYVTLDTTQTITAQKTFTTSGSSDTMIISHGSGSGFALDVIKAGNNEAIRVTKTSGSGNAMSISGGLLLTEGVSVNTPANAIGLLLNGRTSDNFSQIRFGANTGGGQYNSIGASSSSLDISSLGNTPITFSTDTQGSGGVRMTIAGNGAVTLTGALNGTSASFSGNIQGKKGTFGTTGISTPTLLISDNDQSNVRLRLQNTTSGNTWDLVGGRNGANNSDFSIYDVSNNVNALIIAPSTGAATFSSSVSVKGGLTIVRSVTSESSIISNEGNLIYNARDNFNHVFQRNGSEIARIMANGLTFNGDTAAANALDDYEEGTWTPVVGGTTGNPTVSYFTQLGKYVKIGRVVHIFCQLHLLSSSGGSGNLIITGLPFTISGDSDETGGSIGLALGFATLPTVIQPESSTSYVFVMVNESNTPITDLDFTYFNFTVTYLVNT